MEEQNKYYKPSIEEFCLGFKLEWCNTNESDVWVEDKLDNEEDVYHAIHNTRLELDTNYRVKYLDKEDIEYLGWEFGSSNGMRNFYKGSSAWFNNTIPTSDCYRYWEFGLIHDLKFNGIIIQAKTSTGDQNTFFEGTIKNINELQKIMQMLNIK